MLKSLHLNIREQEEKASDNQSPKIMLRFICNNANQLPVCLSAIAGACGIPELVPTP